MNMYEPKRRELTEIVKHYGIEHQLKKLHEEVFELTEAILRASKGRREVLEEFADVQVLLAQIKIWYDLEDQDIKNCFWYKVDRQITRMEEE